MTSMRLRRRGNHALETDLPPSSPPTSPTIALTSPLEPISPWPPLSDAPPTPSPETPHPGPHPALAAPDVLSQKEVYGGIAILLTSLSYLLYLAWAILPPSRLNAVGWTWYPAQEWAVIVPCWLMVMVLLAYMVYAGLTAYLTPQLTSAGLITDSHAHIPPMTQERYYWKLVDGPTPAMDLPVDLVNRVLYPPRRRSDGP